MILVVRIATEDIFVAVRSSINFVLHLAMLLEAEMLKMILDKVCRLEKQMVKTKAANFSIWTPAPLHLAHDESRASSFEEDGSL